MFKPFVEMFENVSEACRKVKRNIKGGFRQGALRAFSEFQANELKKATPRSKGKGKHAADAWKIEYDREGGFIVGFEITNPHDRIDWLEYGTPIHMILPKKKKALRFAKKGEIIFAAHVMHLGIKPLGFVRGVQDKMDREIPHWVRKVFDNTVEKEFK